MGIFTKNKTAEKAKQQKQQQASADAEKHKERPRYIPRYAERDALSCRPGGIGAHKEEIEAFRKANAIRMSRTISESRLSSYNPKMSPRLSRNSSAMSLDWQGASSSRAGNPFASGVSSYQSLPQILQTDHPAPYILSPSSQSGTTTPARSRSGSFSNSGNTSHYLAQPVQRPKSVSRPSYQTASPLAQSPMISQNVHNAESTKSSAESTSSESSSEVIEVVTKRDSKGKAPERIIEEGPIGKDGEFEDDRADTPRAANVAVFRASPERNYFSHPSKPAADVTGGTPTPTTPTTPKKKRFSLMRRGSAIAAH